MKLGPIIDPDLISILREVSADPKSRLMRLVTQGSGGRSPHEVPLSEREPLLTRAERHLVREHREQVAELLFDGARRDCLGASQAVTGVYRGAHAGWSLL